MEPRHIIREETPGFREAAREETLDWSTFQGDDHDADVEHSEGFVTQFVQQCDTASGTVSYW